MAPETFTELALRVLAGEATEAERRTLDAELAAQPALREEFTQLKATHDLLRTVAPLAEAASATGPQLPAYRVGELRTAVRQHFGPAAAHQKSVPGLFSALRWIFAGGGITALAVVALVVFVANSTVEVGLYRTDLVRGGDSALTPADVPSARLVTFDQDAPFDQWQTRDLGWTQHAKVWVDNEHDLLHIVRRGPDGKTLSETQPLAPTGEPQRAQLKQVVESLR